VLLFRSVCLNWICLKELNQACPRIMSMTLWRERFENTAVGLNANRMRAGLEGLAVVS